jgi:hypothetical protein
VPRIVCRACGREVYATAPIEQLFADERRCPRCGAPLQNDRRASDRRVADRRVNPPDDPGPPPEGERRVTERRKDPRRRGDADRRHDDDWVE